MLFCLLDFFNSYSTEWVKNKIELFVFYLFYFYWGCQTPLQLFLDIYDQGHRFNESHSWDTVDKWIIVTAGHSSKFLPCSF